MKAEITNNMFPIVAPVITTTATITHKETIANSRKLRREINNFIKQQQNKKSKNYLHNKSQKEYNIRKQEKSNKEECIPNQSKLSTNIEQIYDINSNSNDETIILPKVEIPITLDQNITNILTNITNSSDIARGTQTAIIDSETDNNDFDVYNEDDFEKEFAIAAGKLTKRGRSKTKPEISFPEFHNSMYSCPLNSLLQSMLTSTHISTTIKNMYSLMKSNNITNNTLESLGDITNSYTYIRNKVQSQVYF